MAVALLALYGLFILLTVGIRAAIQLRRTGSPGVNAFRAETGSAEWVAGMLFIIGVFTAPLAPLLDLLGVLGPIPALDTATVNLIGLAIGVIGTFVVFLAQLAMGDSWQIGVKEEDSPELVTSGIFGIVRNPIYAVTFPTLVGFALMVPSVLALINMTVVILALELQVRFIEEPYLQRHHARAFAAYAARVGRFFPGIGLIKAPAGAPAVDA